MKTSHLSIVVTIGIAVVVSFGIFILLIPHTTEHLRLATPQDSNFGAIAVNPVTDKVYVCNNLIGFVYVLDGHTNKTLSKIPMDGLPQDVMVNPITNKIYVVISSYPRPLADNAVAVIDGVSDTVIKNINITDMGKKPPEMIFNAFQGGKTYKIWPVQISVNPKTNRIYVSDWNYGDGGITVIDGRTDQVIDTIIGLGGGSYGIGVNPNTDRIYVDNVQYGYEKPYQIAVIDGATDKILTNVTIGLRGPHGVSTIPGPSYAPLAVNPSTDLIYASCSGCVTSDQNRSRDWIAVINGTTNTVIDTVPLSVLNMAVNTNTNTVYVTLGVDPITLYTDSFRVAVIDGQTNKVINYLESDKVGSSVAVNPTNDNVYVTGNYLGKGSVSVYDFER